MPEVFANSLLFISYGIGVYLFLQCVKLVKEIFFE